MRNARQEEKERLEQLEWELQRLRTIFRETVEAYSLRVEAQLAQMLDPLGDADHQVTAAVIRKRMQCLDEMLKEIRNFEIQPRKGRRKDLKKIETLADQLASLVEKWQWKTEEG